MAQITTATAALRLNVSPQRVRVLIATGRLPAIKIGRDHLIDEADLALVANRPPGRPRRAHDAAPCSQSGNRIG